MLSHPQILNTHSVNIFPGLDSACIALAKWSSFALRNGQIYFTPWRQKGYTPAPNLSWYTRLGIRSYMFLLFLQTMIFLMFPTCLVLRYRSISYTPIIYWGHVTLTSCPLLFGSSAYCIPTYSPLPILHQYVSFELFSVRCYTWISLLPWAQEQMQMLEQKKQILCKVIAAKCNTYRRPYCI
jgi:hypothetical protein